MTTIMNSKSPRLLWLALYLPRLPLEANAPLPSPSAIVEHGHILLCDEAAQSLGVEPGIGIAAARMLAPAITLIARNSAREASALQSLACWAGNLSPRICVTSDSLLLEIGGCLRLFGGLKKLLNAANSGILAQGFSVGIAAVPTPLGAQWLAQAGRMAFCIDHTNLHQYLDSLPTSILPDKVAAALLRFGLRTLAEVRRLPSAELARRIGMDAMQAIARAYGELPDPRADFVFPEQFSQSLQLPSAVENAAALLFAARRLTAALSGWLTARQMGVRETTLYLRHRQSESRLHLQFAEPTADADRFERVLRERLGNFSLDAPVESLRLDATNVADCPGQNQTLFDEASTGQEAVGALLERLTARFGDSAVYQLVQRDDHRPECASKRIAMFAGMSPKKTSERPAPPRPLWLLDTPEALTEVEGRPYRHGHLKLLSGPERIESGWWDSGENAEESAAIGDVRRDYFIARSPGDSWLWIYRDVRAPGGWFLHGYFS